MLEVKKKYMECFESSVHSIFLDVNERGRTSRGYTMAPTSIMASRDIHSLIFYTFTILSYEYPFSSIYSA